MSREQQPAQKPPRTAPGRPFEPGRSGNPGGRPRQQPGFTARARELSIPVLENMAKIARTGRGISAVKAGELVLAYAEGRPVANIAVTARGTLDDRFRGAARAMLEAAVAEAEAAAGGGDADTETVALEDGQGGNSSDSTALARALPPVSVDRGQDVTTAPAAGATTPTERGTP